MEIAENHETDHQGRNYYANFCNLCFSSSNLMQCSSCSAVSYCSEEHKNKDLPFHKPICMALQEIERQHPFPICNDHKDFIRYTTKVLRKMAKKFENERILSIYETEICLLPWVCPICFKKAPLDYQCDYCKAVGYCSLEHKKRDLSHSIFCFDLRNCRLFASMKYENGAKPEKINLTYRPIDSSEKNFPKNQMDLGLLIQNELHYPCFTYERYFITLSLFLEPYIPGASIICALQEAYLIKNRHLMTKRAHTKQELGPQGQTSGDYTEQKPKSTMTIHFPFADEYELSINWRLVSQLLVDWIHNIDEVDIVLTGKDIEEIPEFDSDSGILKITVYKEPYEEIKFSRAPDVIVVFEYPDSSEVWSDEIIRAIFQFRKVPLIIFNGSKIDMVRSQKFLKVCPYVRIVKPMTDNPFTGIRCFKNFSFTFCTYAYCSNFAILRSEK